MCAFLSFFVCLFFLKKKRNSFWKVEINLNCLFPLWSTFICFSVWNGSYVLSKILVVKECQNTRPVSLTAVSGHSQKKEVRGALWPFKNQNQVIEQEKHIVGIFSALLFARCCCSSCTKLPGVSIFYGTWLIGLLTLSCLTQGFLFVLPWRNVCTDKGYRGRWVALKLC